MTAPYPNVRNYPWDRRFHFYNSASMQWDDGDYVMTKEHGKVIFNLKRQQFVIGGE